MRRLIAFLRHPIHRIRERAAAQHLADLKKMLSGLIDTRDRIDIEITETARHLLKAADHHRALVEARAPTDLTKTYRRSA